MTVLVETLPEAFEPNRLADTRVYGQLASIAPQHYETLMNELDDFEGYFPGDLVNSMYYRLLYPVMVGDGSVVEAWVYFGNPAYLSQDYPRIPGGDWIAYSEAHRK